MKKAILFFGMFLLLFSIACEKIIEIDLEATEPRLVINAIICPDSAVTVCISRSMHILDNHNIVRITNATVKLFDNGIELAQLQHQGNGIYTSPLYPVAGRTYTVIASAPDFEEVTAVCPIPIATGIVQIDTAILKDEYDYPFLNLQVHFNDPESVENYYMLQAYQKYAYEEYDPYGFVVDTLYQNEDTVIVDTTWGIYTTRLAYEPLYLNSSDLIA